MSKIDQSLFSVHEHALEKEYGVCPLCGSEVVVKHSKSGPFLGCASYPHCEYTRPLIEHQEALIKVLEDSECPECSHELAVKNGRYGMFIGCTNFPVCNYVVHEEAENTLPECPECHNAQLVSRSNKSGRTFYSCNDYPKCKYVLNHKPVATSCNECGWTVMIEKNGPSGKYLQCPQKHCGHKQAG